MLIRRMIRFLCGWHRIQCPADAKTALLNRLHALCIDPEAFTHTPDGGLSVLLSRRQTRLLLADADPALAGRLTPDHGHGLPRLLRQYRRRIGIPIGAVLFCLILWLSTRFVWDIRVTGLVTLREQQVWELLASHGFEIGTYLPGVDFHKLCNAVLVDQRDIAWIAVNLSGTVAEVQVVEALRPEDAREPDDVPRNLVAARDGYVLRTLVQEGEKEVKAGDTVTAGQLLIGGVWQTGRPGGTLETRFVCARGQVFAETVHTYEIVVPLSETVTREVGTVLAEDCVKFFSKSIFFYKNSGILPTEYDRIVDGERWTLFAGTDRLPTVALPVFRTRTYAVVKEPVTVARSEAEAKAEAYRRLALCTASELREAELLEREITVSAAEDAVTLTARLRVIEDIAVPRTITP